MFESIIFKYLATLIISMTPIIELRGAIPVAVFTFHLTYIEAFIISLIGNIIPIFFIVKYIRPLFDFFGRFKIFKIVIDWASERATKKIAESEKLQNFTALGLFLFVAIPLPGTGAWVGSLIANFLDLPIKKAFWPLALGVLAARNYNSYRYCSCKWRYTSSITAYVSRQWDVVFVLRFLRLNASKPQDKNYVPFNVIKLRKNV